MKITLDFGSYDPTNNKFFIPKIYRKITREENEEGKFLKLEQDLKKIAKEHGVSYEKACDDYGAVNCDLDKLVELLTKQRYTKWTKLHDYILA